MLCPNKKSLKSCLLLFILAPYSSWAQNPTALPGDLLPGRVEGRLQAPPLEPPVRIDPKVKSTDLKKQTAFPHADKIKFKLSRLVLEGNKALTAKQLTPLYKQYLNKTINLKILQSIADDITKHYRETGYILSQAVIPPQAIKKGVVKIQVVEGFIDQTFVKGKISSPTTLSLLRAYARKISENRPLQIKKLERYTLLANELPGVKVRTLLTPSKTVPGAADLVFAVEQQPLTGHIMTNNYGTVLLGPNQMDGAVFVNSFFYGNQIGFRTVQVPQNSELEYYQLSLKQPLNAEGTNLHVNLGKTRTRPDYTEIGFPSTFTTRGRSASMRVALTHPVIRERGSNLTLEAALETLNTNTNFVSSELFDDRIRSLRVGFFLDWADEHEGVNVLTGQLSQGLDILGARKTGSPNLSRANARSNYTKIKGYVSRLQRIKGPLSILLAGEGQYAFSELLASEEYGVGGVQFGRGYDPSEILGDSGISGKAELQLTLPTKIFNLKALQLFAFYDAGRVWNRNKLSQTPRISLSSTGGGLRFWFDKHLSGQFFVGKPINHIVSNKGNKEARVFFEVALVESD